MNIRRLIAVLVFVFCLSKAGAAESSAEITAQILDGSKPNADREALIVAHSGEAAELVSAMTRNLPVADAAEEYKRIPWIWRVAINAGKRNDSIELTSLLRVSVPKKGEPLRDWQAVVLGGGII